MEFVLITLLNGLSYDIADEQHAVQVFTSALADAFQIHEGDTAPGCVKQPSTQQVLASASGVKEAILAAAIR